MEGSCPGGAAPAGAAGARGARQEQARGAELSRLEEAKQELQEELQKAKYDCSIATGAISSLQRQLESQESQLRRMESEKEMLQKQLRERQAQLGAMSAKVVAEQESKLAEQNQLITELQETVSQLQAEILSSQRHVHQQQQAQQMIQSQTEALEHREVQTRVALKRMTCRFERFRSKIIQATFSTAGSKPPQAELTDEEVLETLQKIIQEWVEFQQVLQQNSITVPSLLSSSTTSLPTSARGRRKSHVM
ncbi:coiled-coil domain-containing protein 27 isoform X2 [Apus apus]|uniref:coiled-coil domain-containing protein 27 isoform X2 n=1 Tax=Apus apus TaxID=8895 RepID=UPI0021F83B2B|nr:coiled-coil domain-containing protein 27 isoform X2 [Apus apus]